MNFSCMISQTSTCFTKFPTNFAFKAGQGRVRFQVRFQVVFSNRVLANWTRNFSVNMNVSTDFLFAAEYFRTNVALKDFFTVNNPFVLFQSKFILIKLLTLIAL